ncbi:hypothetical protein Glove_140g3 [Diversispora epigaea]|uniref:Protein kinase domain-containing protein n=1 Tax=Diversispora epigaea TaxID=1348612 RepID=A0A397J3S2_9GLOM|nr:hypothetical protein Glove_140g3 [Diversispora epigaea]
MQSNRRVGIGTTKDEVKAFQWYLKSAERGNINGQNNLGYCYENGIGTIENKQKAFQWYLKSAKGGNSDGQNNIRLYYKNGIGIIKDEEEAFQWYLKAAEKGNSKAQNNLGFCFENGIGTIENKEKAFRWYLKSAKGGNSDGQNNTGHCYKNGIGITKDEEKAFLWYLKAAENGNSKAQNNLGFCYENGIGTIENNEKAFHWYKISAEGENNDGKYNLGCCYLFGKGTTKDERKAFQWYLKAAEGGNKFGQNSIEYCYRNEIEISKLMQNITAKGTKLTLINNLTSFHSCCICWQTSSCNEICKKYFQDFGICYNCGNLNINKNICPNCKLIEISYLSKWSSDNYEIDKIIQMTQLDKNANEWEIWRWIDYSKLNNIKYLDEGGFGSVWKAEWINIPMGLFKFYNSNQVALKKLKNSQKISSEFLKELSANFKCRDKYVLLILGITQDPITEEYAIVLRYMKNGNLRDFFEQNKIVPWIERLWLLESFIRGLKVIHGKGFIHRDIHPGNLMVTEKFNNDSKLKFIRLGDLGLCRLVNEISSSDVYGVLPYVAPEVLNKHQYTQASDIYSVGIIMWVISTGKIPFSNRSYDLELTLEILKGLRPEIKKGTPQCYAELMKKCWHKDPSERPSVEEILDISEKWIYELMYDDKMECSIMFLNAEQEMKNLDSKLLYNETNHPEVSLTIPWIERLWLLESFIRGLKVIHGKGFIHRDIHPGNLMVTEKFNNDSKLKFIRLGDLGLCRLVNEISSSDVYGVLPYVAPEVLNKHQYTQASDIYSVGIIMWVISTGKIPFSNRSYDLELTLEILKGLRPEIKKGTPQCYAELMKKCWHKDPSERPSVEEILDISEKWIYELMYDDKMECSIMFLNAEQEMKNLDSKLLYNETNHPEVSLTSKLLPPIRSNLLPTIRPSNFDINNINMNNY